MGIRAITSADYALFVHTIGVNVHTMGKIFEGDTRSGNHASIFLLTTDGISSVRLNMIKAGPTDSMGTYELTYCNFRNASSSLHNYDIQAVEGSIFRHVLLLIIGMGRHKYKLACSSVVCWFWV